jgi:hypothetical protein
MMHALAGEDVPAGDVKKPGHSLKSPWHAPIFVPFAAICITDPDKVGEFMRAIDSYARCGLSAISAALPGATSVPASGRDPRGARWEE